MTHTVTGSMRDDEEKARAAPPARRRHTTLRRMSDQPRSALLCVQLTELLGGPPLLPLFLLVLAVSSFESFDVGRCMQHIVGQYSSNSDRRALN
jgi:hypothetical protein